MLHRKCSQAGQLNNLYKKKNVHSKEDRRRPTTGGSEDISQRTAAQSENSKRPLAFHYHKENQNNFDSEGGGDTR